MPSGTTPLLARALVVAAPWLVAASGTGAGSGTVGADGGGPADATGTTDGPCIPDPTDCAGKCGTVTDHCGFAVSCGPCLLGDAGGSGTGGDAGGGGSSGVYCTQACSAQCDCGDVSSSIHASNSAACGPSEVGGSAICCGTSGWPGTLDSECFCEPAAERQRPGGPNFDSASAMSSAE